MMLPPGLRIYLQSRVTLTFDLLTRDVDHFTPLQHVTLVVICIQIG